MSTPKTLVEALGQALSEPEHFSQPQECYKTVKDYLAQHFTVAMLQHPDMEQALMDLFNRITR